MEQMLHYAGILESKLEAVRSKCGGTRIHDVAEQLGGLQMRVELLVRCYGDDPLGERAKFNDMVRGVERFLKQAAKFAVETGG
jgi:hypothetical protein